MDGENKSPSQEAIDSIVLEEEIDPNYVPSEPEVVEYAKWMGMDLEKDQDLFWIAREGLMAPLPKDWKPCRTKDTEDIYYFNFTTGDSTWDHPCDGYYKRLYEEEKKKKETVIKESGDQNRSKAKQDVEQLLGKSEKKKNKKVPKSLGDIDLVKALPAPLGLQKAPLPGIMAPLRMSAPSSLGPLGGGGGGAISSGADSLGGLGRANLLKRPSEMDMKVTSSLDGPRALPSTTSSRDPSPSIRHNMIEEAETKPSTLTSRQKMEQKDREDDTKRGDSDAERSMGRLDVTAGLSSKSRTLGGSSSGAASKLRSSLAIGPADDSEEKAIDKGKDAYGAKADDKTADSPAERSDTTARKSPLAAVPAPASHLSDSSGSTGAVFVGEASSSTSDLSYYKGKLAAMERRVEEYEGRVADYKASYSAAKEDLLALEQRYEASQSQWLDRVRALEVEKDNVESERRRLKLALLDLESAPPKLAAAVAVPPLPETSVVDDSAALENERLLREILDLKRQLHSAQEATARSTTSQAQVQQRLQEAEAEVQSLKSQLEGLSLKSAESLRDYEILSAQLEETRKNLEEEKKLSQGVTASVDAQQDLAATLTLLAEERKINTHKGTEMQRLQAILVDETNRASRSAEELREVERSSELLRSEEANKFSALQQQLMEAQAQLSLARAEIESCRSHGSSEAALLSRTETAEALLRASEVTVSELRLSESNLRREIVDRDKKLSDQQEQLLATQASNNLTLNGDKERSAQFEVFVSQATAIRKSLKSEIEKLRIQLQDLETEKSALVAQLTRQETTLQFAKKELTEVATLKESARQLEVENQQLVVQRDHLQAHLARQAEVEVQLRQTIENLSRSVQEGEDVKSALRQDVYRLGQTVEQERLSSLQGDKKIKSYQEELLQLQRRLAEMSSPQKSYRTVSSTAADNDMRAASTSPNSSPLPFLGSQSVDNSALLELQHQLALKQSDLERVNQQLALATGQLSDCKEQLRSSLLAAGAQEAKALELQEQLRTVSLQLSGFGPELAKQHSEALQERDQMELERLSFQSQIESLQAKLSIAQKTVEIGNATKLRLDSEVKTYREKWLLSEKELTAHRLSVRTDIAGSELSDKVLRAELSESLEAMQQSRVAEDSLRVQLGALSRALEERDSTIRELRSEARSATVSKDAYHSAPEALPSTGPSKTVFTQEAQDPGQSGANQQQQLHIVSLSLEVGRQQATMERLEQHIRKTEQVVQEIKSQGALNNQKPPAEDSCISPSSPAGNKKGSAGRAKADRTIDDREVREDTAWESSTPDSQQSLLNGDNFRHRRGAEADHPASPSRKSKGRTGRVARSVQFQFPAKDRVRRPSTRDFELTELVDVKDQIAALVEATDMDVHDCTTLRGLADSQERDQERLLLPTAKRVLSEGATRLRNETKLLKEVQTVCLLAKEAISHNQECVKRLKVIWRSAKSDSHSLDHGSTNQHGLTTESVNSVTLKVNSAVDDLREVQQLAKAREGRLKSLHQSVQYLEQLVGGHSLAEPRHLLEIMQLVQSKCVESAADLETVVRSYRAKGRPSSLTGNGNPGFSNSRRRSADTTFFAVTEERALGVAFSTQDRPMGGGGGGVSTRENYNLRFDLQSGRGYSSAPRQSSPSRSPARPAFSSHSAPVSISVSGMRNSDLKNRLLQEQINKITERQSISKEVCEKHAGWLSDLGKEIANAAHSSGCNSSSGARSDWSSAVPSVHPSGAKATSRSSIQPTRCFGTALQNQQVSPPTELTAVDALIQNL